MIGTSDRGITNLMVVVQQAESSSDPNRPQINSALHKICTQLYRRNFQRQWFLFSADVLTDNARKMLVQGDNPARES